MFSRTKLAAAFTLSAFFSYAGEVTAQYPGAEPVTGAMESGFKDIDAARCKEWLTILSSDEFEGRETGQDGFFKAAEFMAAHFKEFGLKPIGDKVHAGESGEEITYFQHLPFMRTRVDLESTMLTIEGTEEHLKFADGFVLSLRGGSGDFAVEGEPVFIATQGNLSRIADQEVLKDRIVVLAGKDWVRSPLRRQLFSAGAAAVIEIREKIAKPQASIDVCREQDEPSTAPRVPSRLNGSLTEAAAARIAKALGIDAKFLDSASGADGTIMEIATGKKLKVAGKVKIEKIGVPNVIGMIEGSDPKLKDEYVIMGSHLDHIGISPNGDVNNGADDDGSGSTALLAVARAFSKNPTKPKRSLIFIAVCGEEKGLLGSNWYVEHPIVPIEKTVCELQMDMIGRNEEHHPSENPTNETAEENIDTLHLIGSKRISTELHEIILECNKHLNFKFEFDQEGVYTRSDHYNFARKGIPISFFFSGFHKDYHQPTDEVSKINFEKLSNTARLVYLSAWAVADKEARLIIDPKPEKKSRNKSKDD